MYIPPVEVGVSHKEWIAFSQAHAFRPKYSPAMVERFLTELSSGPQQIIDIRDENGRIALGVVIDKIQNPGGSANLEILGIRESADMHTVLRRLAVEARLRVPTTRTGFQMAVPPEYADALLDVGLKPYYETFEMQNLSLRKREYLAPPQIELARDEDKDEIYNVLCETFAENLETSIPEEASWKSNFLQNANSRFYLWRESGIEGFALLKHGTEDDAGEVALIGVRPRKRGQGLGRKLLDHCLFEAAQLGLTSCRLTVAAENPHALGLYLEAGFEVVERSCCFIGS
jgi:ribosomal protein S18 acetylase RimI-like enzyme